MTEQERLDLNVGSALIAVVLVSVTTSLLISPLTIPAVLGIGIVLATR
jgi:hypothetical protein